ncbi:hypothetical protein P9869_41445 [Streptomyces ossamyceticus]|nr:hypothetical protein [Streptomyces ossamyceticus]
MRKAEADVLERPFRRAGIALGQVPEGESDKACEARQETAAGVLNGRRCPRLDSDGTLRAGVVEAEFDLPPSRSVSTMFHKALMDPGARMMVGGADDVGFEKLVEAWEAASPENAEMIEHIRAAHRDAALAGVDLHHLLRHRRRTRRGSRRRSRAGAVPAQ